jgi:cytochrome P450
MSNPLERFNYLAPETLAEPFEFYALARAQAPVFRVVRGGGRPDLYVVTSMALVAEISQNDALFGSNIGHLLVERIGGNPAVDAILRTGMNKPALLLTSDGAQHKRYRSLVNNVFTSARVNKWGPVIERISDELIDSFIEEGHCDFVNQFAIRLPTYVIADILGFERSMFDRVTLWSDAVIRFVSQINSPDEEVAAAHLKVEFEHFLLDHLKICRANPGDDLVSALIEARVEGEEPLTDEEIGPLMLELSVAGNETTRNTLMNGLAQLLKHPNQIRKLLQDPALIPNAVEEILRHEGPATSLWRVANQETVLAGVKIPKGAAILLRFDSANRDEKQFENPEAFDIQRKNANRHVAFGAPSIHRCLGQMLARKELTIAFSRLLGRLKDLKIDEATSDTRYWAGLLHRGIRSLHLDFTPGGRVAAGAHGEAKIAMQKRQ